MNIQTMADVKCSYCGTGLEIINDDGFGLEEDRIYEQECFACGKVFAFRSSISVSYQAWQADCLNGGSHDYKPSITFPKKYTKMVCQVCVHRRNPTEAEISKMNLLS